MIDYDPEFAELVEGIPTAKDQEGIKIPNYLNRLPHVECEEDEYGDCDARIG